jgi:magnesium transporter
MGKRRKKRRLHIHRRTQPGASPGTVTADPEAHRTSVQVIAYGPDEMIEKSVDNLDAIRGIVGKYPVTWINVDGLGDAATIENLGQIFGLHRLALEDVVNTHQRAKVEPYGEQLFIVARMADLELRANTEQLSMFVGTNFVITFQEEAGDSWEPIRQRIRSKAGRIRTLGPDYLAYEIMDANIDAYFPVLEQFGERLDELEDTVLAQPTADVIDQVHELKSGLLMLRRAIWPHREMLAALARDSMPLITDPTRVYLRDCYDHIVQLVDLTETYRELTADLRDLYMSAISNRINETMRVLTIIATIFIPLTFIAGIYGMNFDHSASPWNMPELYWFWGYPFALGLMTVVAVAMVVFFRSRGWLGRGPARPPRAD